MSEKIAASNLSDFSDDILFDETSTSSLFEYYDE
jgi:hypothetical protein